MENMGVLELIEEMGRSGVLGAGRISGLQNSFQRFLMMMIPLYSSVLQDHGTRRP